MVLVNGQLSDKYFIKCGIPLGMEPFIIYRFCQRFIEINYSCEISSLRTRYSFPCFRYVPERSYNNIA